MNAIETFTKDNTRLEIYQDADSQNPRTEWDNLGTMYCFHGRYNLGDKHNLSLEEAKKLENDPDYITLPIYMYDHSGLTIRSTPFSCPWDSGKIGFIAVSKKKIREEYKWKCITKKRKEQIEKYLLGEIETYDTYLRGEIYGFKLFVDDVETDSCWGFFGSDHKKSGLFENAGWVA